MRRRHGVVGIIGVSALALGISLPAQGAVRVAASPYIAAANGMVGVAETLNVFLPKTRSTTVSISATNGSTSLPLNIALNAAGFGSIRWTPTASGVWTVTGAGSAASVSTQVSVLPTATSIAANAPSQLERNVAASTTQAYVHALAGSAAPQGSVTLRKNVASGSGPVLGTGWLQPTPDPLTTVASITWTPDAAGTFQFVATYNPQTPAFASSVSQVEQPEVVGYNPMVAYRFAPALRVGQSSAMSAVLGANYQGGSVGFLFNGQALRGSVPTIDGVATMSWTPPTEGLHLLRAEFTGNNPGFSGVSLQQIKVLPALPADQLVATLGASTLRTNGQNAIARATSQVLSAVTTSGAQVLFSVTGPCVIAGNRLNAIGNGSCIVTAVSVGSGAFTPVTVNFPITVGDVVAL